MAAAERRAAAPGGAASRPSAAEQGRGRLPPGGTAGLDAGRPASAPPPGRRIDRVAVRLRQEQAAALAAVAAARAELQAAWRDREVLDQLRQRRLAEWRRTEEAGDRRTGRDRQPAPPPVRGDRICRVDGTSCPAAAPPAGAGRDLVRIILLSGNGMGGCRPARGNAPGRHRNCEDELSGTVIGPADPTLRRKFP